ncbi:MAG: ABC transporter ATP-binding protein [Spirochaetaceae bacterium]|nr:MAG: ABC transporter ATP-binding protein [Spirochaetaceae bacterium]
MCPSPGRSTAGLSRSHPSHSPALEACSLTKLFPGASVASVDDVSLSVAHGEVVGLLGANGAGKTTLLRMFASLILPTRGYARVRGYDTVSDRLGVRAAVGTVFGGSVGLYERLTVRENIEYFARLCGVAPHGLSARVSEIVTQFGMSEFVARPIAHCSSGMKQRTALARAIVHHPAVLLLDEPSTGLDIEAALTVQECVRSVSARKTAVLVSSHNTAELAALCSRVIIMAHGRAVAEVPASDFGGGRGLQERFLAVQRGKA